MKKIFIFLLFISALNVTSCKKDEEVKEKTTLEKIQAKWSVENITIRYADSTEPPIDETVVLPGTANDYFDFRTDNKIYSMLDGEADTSAYALSGDSTILFENSGSFQIKILTDNILKLYSKQEVAPELLEQTFNLKK